jgi:hypothetical protein
MVVIPQKVPDLLMFWSKPFGLDPRNVIVDKSSLD